MPKKNLEINRMMASVQASMAVEGLKPSKKARAIGKKYLQGELTSKEAVEMIIQHHSVKVKK